VLRRSRLAHAPPLIVAFVLAALPSCKPGKWKTGMKCSGNEATCIDKISALVCVSDTVQAISCKGPGGCREEGSSVSCAQGVGDFGGVCFAGAGPVCSTDRRAMLDCVGGRFVQRSTCKGPKGCYELEGNFHCDTSEAERGDACTGSSVACSLDHTALLRCKDGKSTVVRTCRGPLGCYHEDKQIHCDSSVALADDACEKGSACTPDGKALLSCAGGTYQPTPCRGKLGCQLRGGVAVCDGVGIRN
jgi:hypothetical protein